MRELLVAFILVTVFSITNNTPPLPEVQAQTKIQASKKPETPKVVKSAKEKKKPVSKPPVQPQVVSQPVAPARPAAVPNSSSIVDIITAAANRYGIDVSRALRIAQCESGFNPSAVNYGYNENGYPSGLFQHLSGYWPARAAKHGYPGASVFDPVANANVTMAMWASGSAGLWECQ